MPKYVVVHHLKTTGPEQLDAASGDVSEAVARLKREPGNELQVHGSGALVQTLMARDLVDEYRVLIHPVVLGNGKRLFDEGTTPTALRLVDTRTTSRGVVAHVYEPSGKPHYGSVGLKQEGNVVRSQSA